MLIDDENSTRSRRNLRANLKDRERLKSLSNLELFREILKCELADDNRVLELMDRLQPNWQDDPNLLGES